MVDVEGGDVFLSLPWVLLEGGASSDSRGVEGLDLPIVERLLEWVWAEGGGELSKTMLPMGGRSLSKSTMSEQVLKESSHFLADLGLADQSVELFFIGTEMFVTFTLFSQPIGWSPAYQNHLFSFSTHSNIENWLYFLAYATTDLVGRSNWGLAEITALRLSGGMRENPQLPNNSCLNEVIMAYQYLCIVAVQITSFYEPIIVTAIKRLFTLSAE